MGSKSRRTYPAPQLSTKELGERVNEYIEQGLSQEEANDLVSLEVIEKRSGYLAQPEIDRRKAYTAKLNRGKMENLQNK